MDEERIKKAENNFKNYLSEGKIKKINKPDRLIYETYFRNAQESLNVAINYFRIKLLHCGLL